MAATSVKLHEPDVKGSEFVPRMTIVQSSAAAAATQHMSKPKRYSTQRQRLPAEADMAGDMPYDRPSTDMTTAQALPTDQAYYGTTTQNLIIILKYLAEV